MLSESEKRIEDGLLRYNAMAGALRGVPAGAWRRSRADRVAFGDIYLHRSAVDGEMDWSAVHALRFMVEICGVTYAEAHAGVVAELSKWTWSGPLPEPEVMARQMFVAARGNILHAILQAKIEAECLAFDTVRSVHMRDVLRQLETMRFRA